MGCGSSHTAVTETTMDPNNSNGDVIKETVNDDNIVTVPIKYPPPEAFEIPLEVIDPDSLIRKHPPKRLQKLIDERPETPKNIQDLEDKLANAEMRRQQILLQRASTKNIVIKQRDKEKDNEEKDNDKIINNDNDDNDDDDVEIKQ